MHLPFLKHGVYMTLFFKFKAQDPGIGITKQYLFLLQLADL